MAGCPSGSRESSAKGMSASSNLVPASLYNYFALLNDGLVEEAPSFPQDDKGRLPQP